jgi:hypothetical protein
MFIACVIVLGAQHAASSAVVSTGASHQGSIATRERGDLAELPVRAVSINRRNVLLALSHIADTYNVPVGFEVSPDDDLLRERNISVQLDSGTLKDVLDAIVSQHPLYAWRVEDDVVNVFPKANRDPALKSLLETRLKTFRVPPRTSRYTFRESLTKTPKVKGVLASFGVQPDNEVFVSRDFAALGRNFSLTTSNATVKAILNRVVRDSETKFWIVNREGPRRQYLLLNL